MPVSITVRGFEEFAQVARRLRGAPKELRSELYRGINRAVKPVKAAIQSSAAAKLPKRGGLAGIIAQSKVTARRRTSGGGAGIKLVTTSPHAIAAMNKGRIRHPVFGMDVWVDQFDSDSAGWWSEPVEENAPSVRKEILLVVKDVGKKVEQG